jgi:hypothetical protein
MLAHVLDCAQESDSSTVSTVSFGLMNKLTVSFKEQNLRLGDRGWLFDRRQRMRFEWLALLAFKRLERPGDQAWVTLSEISRLPSWSGRSKHHIATNVGRYLQSTRFERSQLVTAHTRWAGPYRVNVDALSISFDIPIFEVRKRLHLQSRVASVVERDKLLRFAFSYARAQWLFFQGRLVPPPRQTVTEDNAYQRLLRMVDDKNYGATLRLVACLSAVEVLFRLGRFRAARRTLLQNSRLLRNTPDLSLKAQFHLKFAWAYQRVSSGTASDRAVKAALNKASSYAQDSGDRAALGLLAYRTGGYLTKKRLHMEAINQLILALEAYLITGNYDMVQCTCGNLGSVIHRLGPRHYDEARRWLVSSIAIARWMRLGRDDAHAEMILGKIYIESGKSLRSQFLLKRAEKVATRAGNLVNLADVKMVWGFWHRRFGNRKSQVQTLADALEIFERLGEFDTAQKKRYMEKRFSTVWHEVLAHSHSRLS